MSIKAVRQGCEAHLMTMPGGLPEAQTARENRAFTPLSGTPFQAVHILWAKPENPTMGGDFKRLRGVFMITLSYPFNKGSGDAESMAELIAARFARGLSVTANQVTTIFDRTPDVKAGRVEGNRWEIPIAVHFYANVSS